MGGGGYRSEEGGCAETDTPEIPIAESPSRTARRDEWSRRMRRSTASTRAGSYDPEQPPPSRRGDVEEGDEEGGGRCASDVTDDEEEDSRVTWAKRR